MKYGYEKYGIFMKNYEYLVPKLLTAFSKKKRLNDISPYINVFDTFLSHDLMCESKKNLLFILLNLRTWK